MDKEEFQRKRAETIEMLHPELRREMEECAAAMEMDWTEFMEHLRCVVEDNGQYDYYVNVGDNEAYKSFNWDRIWYGYELITGTTVPPQTYGRYPGTGFNCAC